jgi:DNA-binding response OmpR family regulator
MEEVVSTSLRVLVVDDCEDLANSTALLLKHLGYTVEVAYDGLEAIERASIFLPRVVLLDLMMPRLNGFETARRLRAGMGQSVVLIAVSAWDHQEARRAVREAGFDERMTKPVDLATLTALLETYSSPKSGDKTAG